MGKHRAQKMKQKTVQIARAGRNIGLQCRVAAAILARVFRCKIMCAFALYSCTEVKSVCALNVFVFLGNAQWLLTYSCGRHSHALVSNLMTTVFGHGCMVVWSALCSCSLISLVLFAFCAIKCYCSLSA